MKWYKEVGRTPAKRALSLSETKMDQQSGYPLDEDLMRRILLEIKRKTLMMHHQISES